MRTALLIAASLLATACNGREDQSATSGTGLGENDGITASDEQAPAAPEFVERAAISDMYEIEAAKIALEKSEADSTREFAQRMLDDHTAASQAMKDAVAASGQAITLPETLDAAHQSRIGILNGLDGDDFDREYLSQQMSAHRDALALLKSYAGNGDVPELRQHAQATIPVVQEHHDWLESNSPTARQTPEATGGTPGAAMN